MEHYIQQLLTKKDGSPLIFPEITEGLEATFIENCPAQEYHSLYQRMSSSILKPMYESPLHFIQNLWDVQKGEFNPRGEKEHFRFGRALHLALLEPQKFRDTYVAVPDFGNLRTKKARGERDAWWADQNQEGTFLNAKEMEQLTCMLNSALAKGAIRDRLSSAVFEVTCLFTDPDSKVACRVRPDVLSKDNFLFEIKTTRHQAEGLFSTDVAKMKYHAQIAFQIDGVKAATGKDLETGAIIAMEKEPPYDVCIYMLDDDDVETGRQWYKWALQTYVRAKLSGKWPGKQTEAQLLKLPNWTKYETFPEFNFD